MMWHEFEELAGYQVSFEDYNKIIEPMYMALPDNVTKQEFVQMIDKKRFALKTKKQIENEMKKIANYLFENCGQSTFIDENEKLEELANEYATRFYGVERSNTKTGYWIKRDYGCYGVRVDRGCRFPEELVIWDSRWDHYMEVSITLVK